ncbi:hypothetical protein Tco_1050438 [Tanacetum coccineum]
MGLWYTKDSGFELTGFLNADYAGCRDSFKSTSGGTQFLGKKLVRSMIIYVASSSFVFLVTKLVEGIEESRSGVNEDLMKNAKVWRNELLLKEPNNLLRELRIEVHGLSRVMNVVLTLRNEVKGVTTRGGKMTTMIAYKDEINNFTREPSELPHDKPEEPRDVIVENKPHETKEKTVRHPIELQPFQNVDDGEMTFFLGLQVNQSPRGIFINQSNYVLEILKKYEMKTCDPISTSMEIKDKLDLDKNETLVDATKYRSMIGALMYLTSSRPDIVHATCLCARYKARPTEKHLKEVKRIFRYLQRTVNMGL